MDLNELQSVQSRERQTDSLQQLRATFYQDAADFIQDLEAERDAAAERADDPWNAPEVGRLNDDIDTAKGTVEAIYDRRVGKIVKMASLAAADMPTDDEGLTEEEQALFDQLVAAIEQNREGVFAILDGEDPPTDPTDATASTGTGSPSPERSSPAATPPSDATPDAPAGASSPAASDDEHREVPPGSGPAGAEPSTAEASEPDVGAADLMGGSDAEDGAPGDTQSDGPHADDAARDLGSPGPSTEQESTDAVETGRPVRDGGATDARSADSGVGPPADGPDDGVGDSPGDDLGDASSVAPDGPSASGSPDHVAGPRDESRDAPGHEHGSAESEGERTDQADADVDRTMVRITDDVGPIYGVEGREYDLTADDVVTLPEANVGPLLKQGAAERLD